MPEAEVVEVPEVAAPAVPEGVEQPVEGGESAEKPAAESAPAETPEGEKPAEPEDTPDKRGRNALERRVRRALREKAEAEAKAAELQRKLEESKPKEQDTAAPRLEEFSDIEEFAKAREEYGKRQALKELTARQQAEAQQRELVEITTSWETKVSRAKHDDFDEVVGDLKPINTFSLAIMEAENGEEVAYYLGKHPKEAARIATLNPRAQIREIAKLEAKLLSEPPKPKTPSKAPAPISPVGGTKGSSNDEPSDKDDINTWMKKENERMRRLNGA